MSRSESEQRRRASAHRFGATPAALDAVREPGVQLACWTRRLAPELDAWLASLWFSLPRQVRWLIAPEDDPVPAVADGVARWLVDRGPAPASWLDDIVDLVVRARDLRPATTASVRLESIAHDGCRLFHVDRTALRLLCTYRGPATQWLPDQAVDRDAMGRGDNGHVRDWDAVRSLATGWVAALKGDCWPGDAGHGLVHRSPPASPTLPRILLAIDLP